MRDRLEAPIEDLGEALHGAYPELEAVREVAASEPVYLVGGAVRDLLLGRGGPTSTSSSRVMPRHWPRA